VAAQSIGRAGGALKARGRGWADVGVGRREQVSGRWADVEQRDVGGGLGRQCHEQDEAGA
jgi:hypothetical protein